MPAVTALLLLLLLGFPFYWGAFGHHGLVLPISWGVLVAVAVNLRRWRRIDRDHLFAFLLTAVVSVAVCAAVFELGSFLGRG